MSVTNPDLFELYYYGELEKIEAILDSAKYTKEEKKAMILTLCKCVCCEETAALCMWGSLGMTEIKHTMKSIFKQSTVKHFGLIGSKTHR